MKGEPPEQPRIRDVPNRDAAISTVGPSNGESKMLLTRTIFPRQLTAVRSPAHAQPHRSDPATGKAPGRDSANIAATTAQPSESGGSKHRVRSARDNATVAAEAVASYAGSMPMTADVAVFVTGGKAEGRNLAAVAKRTPSDGLSDDGDDRLPFEDDAGASGGGSDVETAPIAAESWRFTPLENSKDTFQCIAKEARTVSPRSNPPKAVPVADPGLAAVLGKTVNLPRSGRPISLIAIPSELSREGSLDDGTHSDCNMRSYKRTLI